MERDTECTALTTLSGVAVPDIKNYGKVTK